MTTATPQKATTAPAAATKPAAAATPAKPSAEQRLASILTPTADNSTDGKKKPPVKQKSAPAKPAAEAPAKPKAAPQGQAEGDEDAADAATDGADDTDPFDPDAKHAEGGDTGAVDDGDPDGETDDAGDDETGESEGDDDDGTLYKVKVAGKELEVPLHELIKGYSRTADYTQKTEALAKERKELETVKESVKDLPVQRETYVKQAQFFGTAAMATKAALTKFMPAPPNPELAKTDPAAYFAQQKNHEDAKQFVAAIDDQLAKNQSRFAEEQTQAHQKAIKESRVKLYEAMPDMAQPVARQKLREYANSLGFSDQSIQNETNHVLFVCVEKARRWDELQAKKASMKPQAPVQKVTRRTNAAETVRAVKQRDKNGVLADHSKNKTVKSAEKALMAIFSGE